MFDTTEPFLVFWEEKVLAKHVPDGFYLSQCFVRGIFAAFTRLQHFLCVRVGGGL